MGLTGLIRAYHGGLLGILSGRTKSTDHPSRSWHTWDFGAAVEGEGFRASVAGLNHCQCSGLRFLVEL